MKKTTVAIIESEGKFLIAKRRPGGVVGGKWEFPGGKIEANESPEECLVRELREELDVEAKVGKIFDEHVSDYQTDIFKVFAYMVDCCINEQIILSEHDEIRWVSVSEMKDYDFVGNDKNIIKKLTSIYGSSVR